jgi:hypothetical protein
MPRPLMLRNVRRVTIIGTGRAGADARYGDAGPLAKGSGAKLLTLGALYISGSADAMAVINLASPLPIL